MSPFESQLLARLSAIEQQVAEWNYTRNERHLLVTIAQETRGTTFSVAELLAHAATAPRLHASLLEVLGAQQIAKRLGKLLARLAGLSVAVTVERVGDEDGRALWRVVWPAEALLPVAGDPLVTDDRSSIREESE